MASSETAMRKNIAAALQYIYMKLTVFFHYNIMKSKVI